MRVRVLIAVQDVDDQAIGLHSGAYLDPGHVLGILQLNSLYPICWVLQLSFGPWETAKKCQPSPGWKPGRDGRQDGLCPGILQKNQVELDAYTLRDDADVLPAVAEVRPDDVVRTGIHVSNSRDLDGFDESQCEHRFLTGSGS